MVEARALWILLLVDRSGQSGRTTVVYLTDGLSRLANVHEKRCTCSQTARTHLPIISGEGAHKTNNWVSYILAEECLLNVTCRKTPWGKPTQIRVCTKVHQQEIGEIEELPLNIKRTPPSPLGSSCRTETERVGHSRFLEFKPDQVLCDPCWDWFWNGEWDQHSIFLTFMPSSVQMMLLKNIIKNQWVDRWCGVFDLITANPKSGLTERRRRRKKIV